MIATEGDTIQRPDRFPLLDPLRGFAAVGVLLVHTTILSGAANEPIYGVVLLGLDIGVPVFFLLSAFVLYRPFLEARVAGTERTAFTDFGRRRIVRIAPAYWLALTVTAIVPGMAGAFSGNWWVYYGLLQSFPVYDPTGDCAVNVFRCGVPVAWTLSVEMLFYLTLPLLVVFTARLSKLWRGHWLVVELAVVAALSGGSVLVQKSVPRSDLHSWLFFSPLGRGWWFGLGLAFAAVSVHVKHSPTEPRFVGWIRRHPTPPMACGAVLYVYVANRLPGPLAFGLFRDMNEYVAQYLLVGVIAALFLLPAVFGADGGGIVRRVLQNRYLAWIGDISYGIYLWHFAALIFLLDRGVKGFFALTGLTLILAIVCAAVSYHLMERPLMRIMRRKPAVVEPASV